jgi:hypothetical protein
METIFSDPNSDIGCKRFAKLAVTETNYTFCLSQFQLINHTGMQYTVVLVIVSERSLNLKLCTFFCFMIGSEPNPEPPRSRKFVKIFTGEVNALKNIGVP